MMPCNILVVEDEWLIAMDIGMLIKAEGHSVIGPASTVTDALDLIALHKINAAFLDITVGKEKSFPIADRLDALKIPLTFISAYGQDDIPDGFRMFDLLPKPFTSQNLVQQLDKMLGAG